MFYRAMFINEHSLFVPIIHIKYNINNNVGYKNNGTYIQMSVVYDVAQ